MLILPFLLFFLLVGADLLRWQTTVLSVENVADTAIERMEQQGGMDERVAQQVTRWMEKTHLQPEQWSVMATPVGTNGEEVTITLTGRVPFLSFRLFGFDVSVPVEVTRVGISRKEPPFHSEHEAVQSKEETVKNQEGGDEP
ncbi:DUF4320 family protein [Effusibacillus consociatus]|uniref:DUF4320 family protein n=1 Tax=Effusibacillus consociatus TaxID=1117041 RepID=UPI0036D2ABC0